MATFGENLRFLREKKEISQKELGTRLNLSQSTIAYYELDKKQPPQNTLNKIADFFGVTTDYLLGRDKKTHIHGGESEEGRLRKEIMMIVNNITDEKELDFTLEVVRKMLGK